MSTSPPLIVADRYRLVAPLGQGGMGRVWRATDVVLHREVAIKELVPPPGLTPEERQEMRERSLREARAIARLNNINVVRVFDVLRTDADPWIVMEYVPSRSLQDVLAADGPFPPVRAAEMGLGVLNALRAAHRAGVVHRDVKPGNVLIGEDGRVVLTDFGLATVPGDPNVTRTGLVLGSPAYIAPERARDGTAGPGADLWSLGATLYAAVEGASPFARPSAIATLAALATENPPPARNAGPLKPVLNGLLRKDPAHRINAEEAERLLLRATGRRSKLSFPMSPTMRRPGVGRERPSAGLTPPVVPGVSASAPVVPGPRPPVTPGRPSTTPGRPPVIPSRSQSTPVRPPVNPGLPQTGPAAGGRPPIFAPGKASVGRPAAENPTRVDGQKPPELDATKIENPNRFGTGTPSSPPPGVDAAASRRPALDATMRGSGSAFGSITADEVAAHRKRAGGQQAPPATPPTTAPESRQPTTQPPKSPPAAPRVAAARATVAESRSSAPPAAEPGSTAPRTPTVTGRATTSPTKPATPRQSEKPAATGAVAAPTNAAAPTIDRPAATPPGTDTRGGATPASATPGSDTPGSADSVDDGGASAAAVTAKAAPGPRLPFGSRPAKADAAAPATEAEAKLAEPEAEKSSPAGATKPDSAARKSTSAGKAADAPTVAAESDAAESDDKDSAATKPGDGKPEDAETDDAAAVASPGTVGDEPAEKAVADADSTPESVTGASASTAAAVAAELAEGASAAESGATGAETTPSEAESAATKAGANAGEVGAGTETDTPGSDTDALKADTEAAQAGTDTPKGETGAEAGTDLAEAGTPEAGVEVGADSSENETDTPGAGTDVPGTESGTPQAEANDPKTATAGAEDATAGEAADTPATSTVAAASTTKASRKKGRTRTAATAAAAAAKPAADTAAPSVESSAAQSTPAVSAETDEAAGSDEVIDDGEAVDSDTATDAKASADRASTDKASADAEAEPEPAVESTSTDATSAAPTAAPATRKPATPKAATPKAASRRAETPKLATSKAATTKAAASKAATPKVDAEDSDIDHGPPTVIGAPDAGRTRVIKPSAEPKHPRETTRAPAVPVSGGPTFGQPSRPAWQPMTVRAPSAGARGITVFGTTLTRKQTAIAISVLVVVLLAFVFLIPRAFGSESDDQARDNDRPAGVVPAASAAGKPSSTPSAAVKPSTVPGAGPVSPAATSAPVKSAAASVPPVTARLPAGWEIYDGDGYSVPVPSGATRRNTGDTEVQFTKDNRLLIIDQTDQPKPDPVADWQDQEAERRNTKYRNYQRIALGPVKYHGEGADWEFTYTTPSGNPQHALKRGFITTPGKQAYSISWYTSPEDWEASKKDLQVIYQGFKPER